MTTLTIEQMLHIDRENIWHPYSSLPAAYPAYPVAAAKGVRLTLADGRELIDGMSSWWCALHGYNHPRLNAAIESQLKKMSHVMFGGLTHEPAVKLTKLLIDITPDNITKVFFADSGSVAIEVAIKMALQYWYCSKNKQKTRLLTVRSGYHGDTLAAMSVCDPVTGMHHLFSGVTPEQFFAEAPACRFADTWNESYITDFKSLVEKHHKQIAAVILEPIVQGAGGMRFYSPDYLRRVRQLCDQYDILLILDEIATGFGRTGKLLGCYHAGIRPDIMCLGKSLTGGYMTLAATLCSEKISSRISKGEAGVFMHGPTFMANPLACAVSIASIELLLSSCWQSRVASIESQLAEELSPCKLMEHVEDVRALGAIGVVELKQGVDMATIQPKFVSRGVWVRPFGKLIYLMPPFIIEPNDLRKLTAAVVDIAGEL
ncbi:MAG: adenosylmethionine--8-amino-7-oxononanoate transaminase [Desulfobacteraceae bacterium]|nr:adenosylmethionine--8-amino-7-oxononanoate transaminase [Desulfobacteraceae bacterium]